MILPRLPTTEGHDSRQYLCLLGWPLSQPVSAVPALRGDPGSAGREGGSVHGGHG